MRASVLATSCAVLLLATGAAPAVAGAAPQRPSPDNHVIKGHYIVVYEDAVRDAAAKTGVRERRLGFHSDMRYEHALQGFSAELSPAQVGELRRDAAVEFITPDRKVESLGEVALNPGDTAPAGVRRILAATDTTTRHASGAGVAVIDTGIQLSHPDLNAVDGTNCISPGAPAHDDHGHGTHIAGTVAAKNNGSGLVGVAPGTRIHAVKVLDDDGSGSTSSVVCGIDWVTANRASQEIAVANMSLGGSGPPVKSCASTPDALHRAICNSTAAGVHYTVAAGNEGWSFDYTSEPDVPAAYPEVLTVTAVSDSDGLTGGVGGAPSCRTSESDDKAASFSNFAETAAGRAHTIAAPGVCIRSTWPGSGYRTISGSSMASPHVAGIAALCIDAAGTSGPCAGKTPAQVIDLLRGDAEAYNTANPDYGFAGDPSSPLHPGYYGFLTRTPPADPPVPPPLEATVGGNTDLPARLRVSRSEMAGGTLVVRGALDPAAAGERLAVRLSAAGKEILIRPMVQPNGQFAVDRRLFGTQRDAGGGRLRVRFDGNERLRATSERLRAAAKAVELRIRHVRLEDDKAVVSGRVAPGAGGKARIRIKFNRVSGEPAEIAKRVKVSQRGRFRARLQVPSGVRDRGAWVSISHPGRGSFFGQRRGQSVRG